MRMRALCRLRAERAGRAPDAREDDWHRGDGVHVPRAALPPRGRGRAALGAQEVDPLLSGHHRAHLHCGTLRVRPRARRGRRQGAFGLKYMYGYALPFVLSVLTSLAHAHSHAHTLLLRVKHFEGSCVLIHVICYDCS